MSCSFRIAGATGGLQKVMFMMFLNRLMAVSVLAALPLAAMAEELVLTVSHNGEKTSFAVSELEEIGIEEFETTTIWTEGVQTFTGVSLAAFLNEFGVTEGTIKATAINDYAVEIPVEDAVEGGPIIAYRRNGETMSVRDKGPLWIVYPYDADPAYQTEVIYSRSIWQLDRVELIE